MESLCIWNFSSFLLLLKILTSSRERFALASSDIITELITPFYDKRA